ncbi:MAG: demethoxyubiquinone hydroxylase family protein [Dehalococcoidia bacterium]|nr:demethoxyubiquinone hydroxylase family protein [Dehalococcoidia bacterium]
METKTTATASPADIKRFRENYQGEIDGIAIYRRLAAAENDPQRSRIFLDLAETEQRHLKIWADKLRAAGVEPPQSRPSFRVRMLGFLAGRFGVRAVLPVVSAMESRGFDDYMAQQDAGPAMARNERAHARTLATMYSPGGSGDIAGIARGESWHRVDTGGQLRASIFGISDGLISNLSLVIGVAGAHASGRFIVLAGVAGLLAGAFSMGAGEWISVTSQRELFERQIALEREELEADPEEERRELALIYRAKGLTEGEAHDLSYKIIADRSVALETLAREELGLNPAGLGSPWGVAVASFLAFAGGAIIPLLPWFFGSSAPSFIASILLSTMAAFLVGAGVSLFTGRNPLFAGLRQVGIAAVAAGVTFAIGSAIGTGAS